MQYTIGYLPRYLIYGDLEFLVVAYRGRCRRYSYSFDRQSPAIGLNIKSDSNIKHKIAGAARQFAMLFYRGVGWIK